MYTSVSCIDSKSHFWINGNHEIHFIYRRNVLYEKLLIYQQSHYIQSDHTVENDGLFIVSDRQGSYRKGNDGFMFGANNVLNHINSQIWQRQKTKKKFMTETP